MMMRLRLQLLTQHELFTVLMLALGGLPNTHFQRESTPDFQPQRRIIALAAVGFKSLLDRATRMSLPPLAKHDPVKVPARAVRVARVARASRVACRPRSRSRRDRPAE